MGNKKLFIIAGGIAVAIVGLIYFDSHRQAQAPTAQNSSSDSVSETQWKTYRNDELGFVFQYPRALTFTEEVERDNLGPNSYDWWKIKFFDSTGSVFTLDINNPGMGFEGYDLIGTEGWTNPNSIYMQRTAYGHVVDGVAEIALMLYSFEAEENEYLFVSWGYDIEVFDKVISTFKFIDP